MTFDLSPSHRVVGIDYGSTLLSHAVFLESFEPVFKSLLAEEPIPVSPSGAELAPSAPSPHLLVADVSSNVYEHIRMQTHIAVSLLCTRLFI